MSFLPLTLSCLSCSSPYGIPARPFGSTSTLFGCATFHQPTRRLATRHSARTTMTPVRSHSVSLLNSSTPISRFSGTCAVPQPCTTRLLWPACCFFAVGICSSSRMMSVPPGASASYASNCVSATEMASRTYSTGWPPASFCTSEMMVDAGSLRSSTAVAPSDLRRGSLCNEAVVMMGEYPESFAIWIATDCVSGLAHTVCPGRTRARGKGTYHTALRRKRHRR